MRSFSFNVAYWILSIAYGLAAAFAALAPGRGPTGWVIRRYVRRMVQAMALFAGIRLDVRGKERLPEGAFIIASKHQSWGDGFAMAQARLGPGRVHHCMRTIGQCELALALATERALERQTFGRYLSDYANVQDWLAESRIEIDQARLLVLQTAWLLDQGDAVDVSRTRAQVAAIKVVAARLQTRVVDRAMQVFGAMGLSPDTPLAQFWSWGRALHFMDGPDEVHLRSVARHELGLARARMGESSAWFTTPEQLRAPPRIR